MKALASIFLLALLVGCATPYNPVYVTDEGDYYIAERATGGSYYGGDSAMLTGIELYPWWVSGYPPQVFAYYSPYFYPYYFSVWYPPAYWPHYGYYHAYWRTPYWPRWHHGHGHGDKIPASPVQPPVASYGPTVFNPTPWRIVDRVPDNRDIMQGAGGKHRVVAPVRAFPSYTRTPAVSSWSTRQAGPARSAALSRPSARSGSISSSMKTSSSNPKLNRD